MIVVGGEALIDRIVAPDGSIREVPGGGPYNTARTIARLGAQVAFVGGLSTDRFGELLHDHLVDDGVDVRFALRTDAPTTLAIAELDAGGSATYRFELAGTSAAVVDVDDIAGIPPDAVDAVHIGTLGLVLEPLADALEALVARAPIDAAVMVDVNARPSATPDIGRWRARIDRVLRRADVVKVSTDDLAALRPSMPAEAAAIDLLGAATAGGASVPDLTDGGVPIRDVLDGLSERGPAVVLWTDGPNPVRIVSRRGTTEVPVPGVAVVDTIGAGDAFGGAFLCFWVAGGLGRADLLDDDALVQVTGVAVQVAAITTTRSGTEPPHLEDLVGDV